VSASAASTMIGRFLSDGFSLGKVLGIDIRLKLCTVIKFTAMRWVEAGGLLLLLQAQFRCALICSGSNIAAEALDEGLELRSNWASNDSKAACFPPHRRSGRLTNAS